jgi:hypothetical protein
MYISAQYYLSVTSMFSMVVLTGAASEPGIELGASTSEGMTVQLVIPDFQIDWKEENGRRFQTVSFPDYQFTTIAGAP